MKILTTPDVHSVVLRTNEYHFIDENTAKQICKGIKHFCEKGPGKYLQSTVILVNPYRFGMTKEAKDLFDKVFVDTLGFQHDVTETLYV